MKCELFSLEFIRTHRGLSYQDVADKLNVSVEEVKEWENGKQINGLVIYALAKLYRVEIDHIKVPT